MTTLTGDTGGVVAGRGCGDCSLCCKLIRVDAFAKPAGTWCRHCAPGGGRCKIYDDRPTECREFYCAWMVSPGLGDEWRPNRCKMVVRVEADGMLIAVHVDPSDPVAWRRAPYYQKLKAFAAQGMAHAQRVVVYIRNRVIVVLPDRDLEAGTMNPGDHLVVRQAGGPGGAWQAFVEAAK